MNEILTDELLEEIAEDYLKSSQYVIDFGLEAISFDIYLKEELQLRAWNLRKGGIHVKI